jgi:hypothetical protein
MQSSIAVCNVPGLDRFDNMAQNCKGHAPAVGKVVEAQKLILDAQISCLRSVGATRMGVSHTAYNLTAAISKALQTAAASEEGGCPILKYALNEAAIDLPAEPVGYPVGGAQYRVLLEDLSIEVMVREVEQCLNWFKLTLSPLLNKAYTAIDKARVNKAQLDEMAAMLQHTTKAPAERAFAAQGAQRGPPLKKANKELEPSARLRELVKDRKGCFKHAMWKAGCPQNPTNCPMVAGECQNTHGDLPPGYAVVNGKVNIPSNGRSGAVVLGSVVDTHHHAAVQCPRCDVLDVDRKSSSALPCMVHAGLDLSELPTVNNAWGEVAASAKVGLLEGARECSDTPVALIVGSCQEGLDAACLEGQGLAEKVCMLQRADVCNTAECPPLPNQTSHDATVHDDDLKASNAAHAPKVALPAPMQGVVCVGKRTKNMEPAALVEAPAYASVANVVKAPSVNSTVGVDAAVQTVCGALPLPVVCDGMPFVPSSMAEVTSDSSLLLDHTAATRQLPTPFEDMPDGLQVVANVSMWLKEYVAKGSVPHWFAANSETLMQKAIASFDTQFKAGGCGRAFPAWVAFLRLHSSKDKYTHQLLRWLEHGVKWSLVVASSQAEVLPAHEARAKRLLKAVRRYKDLPKHVLHMTKQPKIRLDNYPTAEQHGEYVTKAIEDLLQTGASKQCAEGYKPRVINPLMVVDNGSKLRLVIDPLLPNLMFKYEKLRYESVHYITEQAQPGDFGTCTDEQAGFHHVPLHPDMWDLLAFQWQGKIYVFTHMPFGAGPAPWTCTLIKQSMMKVLRKVGGIRVTSCIDDQLTLGATKELAQFQQFLMLELQRALGFTMSTKKCVLVPVQRLPFLGFEVDLLHRIFWIPEKKIAQFQEGVVQLLTMVANSGHQPPCMEWGHVVM